MFTGLVEDVGRVEAIEHRSADAIEIVIAPSAPGPIVAAELALGDSVAVDGVCLTVTAREAGRFRMLAGPETLARTTLGTVRIGHKVNLERALRASDRLGGHIMAGHVDGVGEVAERRQTGPALFVSFRAAAGILRYVVEKGSIAVDGISLTVNQVDEYSFAVGLIPHTLDKTTLRDKHVGAKVNLEVDIVGKYVERFVQLGQLGQAGQLGRHPGDRY